MLAAVVQLLEKTFIRVGNEEYARQNKSIGLTTMRDGHAKVNGGAVQFVFRGKSGIRHAIDLRDRRLAAIVKCLPRSAGHELFQYLDPDGTRQAIRSADVNAYLREMTGQDFTAKDFRTWAGTVLAAKALAQSARATSKTHAKREIGRAIESVAQCLGNTKTVCRKSYIHPAILDAYADGATIQTSISPGSAATADSTMSRPPSSHSFPAACVEKRRDPQPEHAPSGLTKSRHEGSSLKTFAPSRLRGNAARRILPI